SRWLKDYVYIPLGGSRCKPWRRDVNLVATFLVSGIWHGAGLTYLLWGFLHGTFQALENHLPWRRAITKGWGRLVGIAGTFSIFVFTFTIFRA
ncbi:MBOAT family protein, partial [Gemmiger formicilis]|uniref:MBOAT family O-acyltransferase n=1 Tax=Gemmiger formicilis TaxID=745368 RepID=UPI001D5CEA72